MHNEAEILQKHTSGSSPALFGCWPKFWGSKSTNPLFLTALLLGFRSNQVPHARLLNTHLFRWFRNLEKMGDQNCRLWLSGTVFQLRTNS